MDEEKSKKQKERKSLYKAKRLEKQWPGRVERLKEVVHKRDLEVNQLNRHTMSLKKLAANTVSSNKLLKKYVGFFVISIMTSDNLLSMNFILGNSTKQSSKTWC